MNWRAHLFVGILPIIVVIIMMMYNLKRDAVAALLGLEFLLFLPFYVGGLLAPDSDSEDSGSKIFYTFFFPMAWFFKLVEIIMCKILKRERHHRGHLHSLLGITVTSFTFVALIALIISFFENVRMLVWVYAFAGLFIGQIVHVICDWEFKLI